MLHWKEREGGVCLNLQMCIKGLLGKQFCLRLSPPVNQRDVTWFWSERAKKRKTLHKCLQRRRAVKRADHLCGLFRTHIFLVHSSFLGASSLPRFASFKRLTSPISRRSQTLPRDQSLPTPCPKNRTTSWEGQPGLSTEWAPLSCHVSCGSSYCPVVVVAAAVACGVVGRLAQGL